MNNTRTFKILAAVVVLALAMMACDISAPTEVPLTPTAAPPPTQIVIQPTAVNNPNPAPTTVKPTVGPQPTSSPLPDTLSSAQKRTLARSTVRIAMTKRKGGQLVTFGTGSGTIISKDGLILTNAHVASPASQGEPEDEPDELVIEMVEREDQPPVATYLTKVVAVDGIMDLAVLRIDRNLNGSPVDRNKLNLPFVPLSNSDNVQFGDTLYIFGFPGIGGDTITFTSGNVAGFDRMEPLGDRAWIKTDATIAGGNSGGLATNTRGEIIGVPTRGGTSSASRITDCRRIADTNGDGKIDEKDSCVPMGGFINAIRPVNWAMPLIKSAQTATAYTSPYGSSGTTPKPTTVPAATGAAFTLNTWTTAIDTNNCPVDTVKSFPSGVLKMYAVFSFKNLTKDSSWKYRWLTDQREVFKNEGTWKLATSGNCFSFSLGNNGKALPDGKYTLEVFAGPNLGLAGTATISVGGVAPTAKAVEVGGQVVDANTGDGIPDIYVITLKPGVDPDAWLTTGKDEDILTFAQTDADGFYTLPDRLPRGQSYGMVVGNKKSGYTNVTGFLEITADDPDPLQLDIELVK